MEAQKKKEQYEMQKQASLIYAHADLIGASVSRLFGNNSMPSFKDVFGYLFDDEQQEEIKKEKPDAELENSKLRIMAAIQAAKKKGGGVNGG